MKLSCGSLCLLAASLAISGCARDKQVSAARQPSQGKAAESPVLIDLRPPMELAAYAVARRLDPARDYRPWFLLRGQGGIPATAEHASWDLGDMTGRYLEGLILARRMGICHPELSAAEGRLQQYLLKLLGEDGLVHDPDSGSVDHPFSQGSALYGLVAWFEDSRDPAVRQAIERLISALLRRSEDREGQLIEPAAKLPESSGSHLAGYQIHPVIRFYELTGHADALKLAEGRTRWAMADPVIGADGAITKALSWEGHIHSWLDTLAGCARTTRNSPNLDRDTVLARCRAVYDWVRRSNSTSFGWIATYPTGGSSETCAISSAIRLAIELASAGMPEYLDDIERFALNQAIEAQFRDLNAYVGGPNPPSPLLIGCFDSQSMPNGHLGTRGGEDVGTVEGCCLNGGMRALALAWDSIVAADESGVTVNLAINYDGSAARVVSHQPFEGRVDVVPRVPGFVKVRLPSWVVPSFVVASIDDQRVDHAMQGDFVVIEEAPAMARVCVRYPMRDQIEEVTAGGRVFQVRWKGNVVVDVRPGGGREPTYQGRLNPRGLPHLPPPPAAVPDSYEIQDAVCLAASSMLARLDLERGGQPFFRIYPFAKPPRAEHEKWDDGDMSGRYVEALILVRRMTGIPLDRRELMLESYLADLFDPNDGLCYTRQAAWTPRRACLFSQSCAMLGLLAMLRETGDPETRRLLDRHVDGLMRIAVKRGNYALFPKYEYDGADYVDDPKGKDAPTWYGGRLILPLVEYWQLTKRQDVFAFIEELIRYSTQISGGVTSEGEVKGNGWWGHLHSTMDMASGIAEFGRLKQRPELVAWAKRVYDWIGRTHTTRYGWVADVSGGNICESCAIASRIRLGLALYRAGAADPFDEIDRFIRNQMLESQFRDLSFLEVMAPEKPRSDKAVYAGVDRMIRGTFQCWGTANDLIGHDDIEGCGAGGGVQGLALAWDTQYEWQSSPKGTELRIHLLCSRRLKSQPRPPLTMGGAVAGELRSYLPHEGRVDFTAHQPIPRLALRIPEGADLARARATRFVPTDRTNTAYITQAQPEPALEGHYMAIRELRAGERIQLTFPLREYETIEKAAGITYYVKWRGNAVLALEPRGTRMPLYKDRQQFLDQPTRVTPQRYP